MTGLTEEQFSAFYSDCDDNGDGVLTLTEFTSAIANFFKRQAPDDYTKKAAKAAEAAARVKAKAEAEVEAKAEAKASAPTPVPATAAALARSDEGEDDDEPPSAAERAARIFLMCDLNHDGTASKSEMIRALRRHPVLAQVRYQ